MRFNEKSLAGIFLNFLRFASETSLNRILSPRRAKRGECNVVEERSDEEVKFKSVYPMSHLSV